MRDSRRVAAVMAVTVATLIAAASVAGSAAAATWQPTTTIAGSTVPSAKAGTPGYLDDPWLAVDGLGNSYIAWAQQTNASASNAQLEVSSRPPGGTWAAAQTLPSTNAVNPKIAANAAGDVAAAWRDVAGSNGVVRAAVRWAGGDWGSPQTVSGAGTGFNDQRVAVDPGGNVLLVWLNNTSNTIEYSTLAHGGSTWSSPVTLSPAGKLVYDPNVALGPTGAALIAWGNTSDNSVQVVGGTVMSGFGAVQTLFTSSGGTINSDPQVAVGPSGEGYATWQDSVTVSSTSTNTTYVASAPSGGSFGSPVTLASEAAASATNPYMTDAQVRVDAVGNALAVWQQYSGTGVTHQRFATRRAGGSWSTAANITDDTLYSFDADPEFAPDGTAYLIYHRRDFASPPTVNYVTFQTLAPGSSSWSAPVNLTANGGGGANSADDDPQMRFDSAGNATATWFFDDGSTNQMIQAAGLGASPPRLTAVSFPAGGQVGSPLPFSASPLWVWTPIISTTWSFGDGSSLAGTSVTHRYSGPGTFAATVTATDAAGLTSTTATGTVRVTPAPPPPAPPQFSITVVGFSSTARNGTVTVTVTCPAGTVGACHVTDRLYSASGKLPAAAFSRSHKRKPRAATLYGQGSAVIAPGRTATIAIQLTAAARTALRQHKTLAARSIVVARDDAGHVVNQTTSVKLHGGNAKQRKKH